MSDKGKYRNRWYAITVTIPTTGGVVAVGDANGGSVTVVDLPFILKKITHKIVGENGIPAVSAPDQLYQDGQYTIEWRTETHLYMSEPLLSSGWIGTDCDMFDVPTPEEFPAKTTFTVDIANQFQRESALTVQVLFHGVEPQNPTRDTNA